MMDLKSIDEALVKMDEDLMDVSLVNRSHIIDFINNLKGILFPRIFKRNLTINRLYLELVDILTNINNENIDDVADKFFKSLPNIKRILLTDVDAFIKGDPACNKKEEIIFTYNSFYAIYIYRIAHLLDELGVRIVPRLLSEYAHASTGIDIHPKAKIDSYFFIDHGTGIVIGETCEIGKHVSIYQGVTLGAISLKDASSLRNKKRHPTIKDNVTIYANATILGGDTVIYENVTIGASCFITKSVDKTNKEACKRL